MTQHTNDDSYLGREERVLFSLILGLMATAFAWLAFTRSYFTFGTESDYLGTFIREAERLLSGAPLSMNFHPPFYSIVLAGFFSLIKDWFYTGLTVTWISSFAAMGGSFLLFRRLAGPDAAWGSLLTLVTSKTFFFYSALATSDVFFLALYTSTCLLLLIAEENKRPWLWTAAGIMLGLSLLTRTNGITLLLFLATPLFAPLPQRQKLTATFHVIAGLIIPLLIWGGVAKLNGSPFAPTQTHTILAQTYFVPKENRITIEGYKAIQGKFSSILQVLSYDPVYILKTYLKNLVYLFREIFGRKDLLAFPLNWLGLAGLYFLFRGNRRPFGLIFFVAAVFQVLLLNLKTYEARYFLFLIPLLGASAGVLGSYIFTRWNIFAVRKAWVVAVIAIFWGITGYLTYPGLYAQLHAQDKELSEVLSSAGSKVDAGAVLYVRKPHLSYYLKSKGILFPQVESVDQLEEVLKSESAAGTPVYLYYGSMERQMRPNLGQLSFAEQRPEWLETVAASDTPGQWVLYRYR